MAAGPLGARRSSVRETVLLAGLAAAGPITALVGAWAIGLPGWFNDFDVYYLAARLVATGRSPYDTQALVDLGRALGVQFVVGGGYSYPPPFAVALVPLAALPVDAAVAIFTAVSIVAFALTMASWLPRVLPERRRVGVRRGLAFASGFYPPVAGSVFAGQANLLVLALLGFGLAPFISRPSPAAPALAAARGADRRSVAAGVALGLAAIVKLAPFALAAPLGLVAARLRPARLALAGLVVGALGSLALAAVLAPASVRGATSLASLFAPDAYWTNQSINGAISRVLIDGDRTNAIVRGDPVPWVVAATALLTLLTLVVLVRALVVEGPAGSGTGGVRVATALAFATVAAALGAPKNSFWNDAPVVLAIGLGLAAGTLLRGPVRIVLVAGWVAATVAEFAVDRLLVSANDPRGPVPTLLSNSGALALALLWLAFAGALLERRIGKAGEPRVMGG